MNGGVQNTFSECNKKNILKEMKGFATDEKNMSG